MSGSKWGDFLTEKTIRGGFNRLRNWREKGEIVIWIHTATTIHKRLFHMIPYVGMKKDEKTEKERKAILYLPFVCHEDVKNYLRAGKNFVPCHCPLCRFIEKLKTNGDINDNETVWDSSIGDRKRDRICTKADFVGDTEGGGDWRLTFKPSMQYVIAVIDHENPGEGIRVAAEKFSLGEKIKTAVSKEIDRHGPDLGDPDRNPYAFKWVFNPNARVKTDFYDAYPFERAEMTEEIQELLKQPEMDLSAWITPGDTKALRDAMEAHVTVEDIDFDELFDNVLPNQGTTESDEAIETVIIDTKEESKTEPKKTKTRSVAIPAKESKPEPKSKPKPPPVQEEKNNDTLMQCPSCRGKGVKKDGKPCKVCDGTGKVEAPDEDVEVEVNEAPPPQQQPKPDKKTRSIKPPDPEPEPESDDDDENVEVAECGRCHKDVPVSANSCPHCGASFL